jgi:hypothetical protein
LVDFDGLNIDEFSFSTRIHVTGSAVLGADYLLIGSKASPIKLYFEPQETRKTIRFFISDNSDNRPTRTIVLHFVPSSLSNVQYGPITTHTVRILDDDGKYFIAYTRPSQNVDIMGYTWC